MKPGDKLQAIIRDLRESGENGMAAARRRLANIDPDSTARAAQKAGKAEDKVLAAERLLAAAFAIEEHCKQITVSIKSRDSDAAFESLARLIPILTDARVEYCRVPAMRKSNS